jgi:ankyrin repeat domain-containing protein 50
MPYRPALPAVPNAETSTGPPNTTNASTVTGALENEASRNCALKLAIEKHLDALPEAEKEVFRESSKKMTEDNLVLRIKTCDARHERHSRFRPQAETLSKFLGLLNRFMAGIAIGIQANPDISSIIVGAVRVVIDLAINFVTFFIRLSEMLSRFGDFLGPLTEYAKASEQKTLVRETLANVYGDLLRLCTHARSVFIDERGAERKWTSWRVFWQIQWVPFEEKFGKIESDLQHHLDVLRHSTQAVGINASLEASHAEKERRIRERGSYIMISNRITVGDTY